MTTFTEYTKMQKGTFLKASMIKTGLKGKILDRPKMTQTDFNDGRGLRDIANMPMEVEGFGDVIWSPGKNASSLLVEKLGPDDTWKFPIPGKFDVLSVNGRIAWAFMPEGGKQASVNAVDCPFCDEKPSAAELASHVFSNHRNLVKKKA